MISLLQALGINNRVYIFRDDASYATCKSKIQNLSQKLDLILSEFDRFQINLLH